MVFPSDDPERRFRALWEFVQIARPVPYTLFTFGSSDLLYYLVVAAAERNELVQVSRGQINVTRPMLITPYHSNPEFRNFFEDQEFSDMVEFVLQRTAAFSNLKLENQQHHTEYSSDSVEEVVARLSKRLDDEDEDRVAILTAPAGLGPLAILKYTTERILESAPGNIRELREKGFLPD